MTRIRMLIAVTAVVALASTGVALAAATKVVGGSTQVALSSAASSALTANHLTVTALAPATASGPTFTFPITRGHLNAKMRGVIRHAGGFAISNGTRTVRLRRLMIVSAKGGVSLFALVRGATKRVCDSPGKHHLRLHCISRTRYFTARVARVTGVSVSGQTATGTVHLTAFSARAIDALAGKHIASAGTVLGTATVTPQLG